MDDTVKGFSAMLRDALGERLDPLASWFVEMFHPAGVMEFPYAFGDMPKQVIGREALARHLSSLAKLITIDRVSRPTVIETQNRGLVVLEFEGFGMGVATGEPYEQRYLSVIRTQGGFIVHHKDFWNPLVAVRALHGAERVSLLTRGDARHD